MRKEAMVFAALALSACAAGNNPKVDLAAEETAVRAASGGVSAAEANRDFDKAITYWSDDAVIQMNASPEIKGKAEVLKGYHDFFDGLPKEVQFKSETKTMQLAASGDLAWETGVNTFTNGDHTDKGKYLVVWKKVDGAWKIAGISVTGDAPQAAAPAAPAPAVEKK